MQKAFVLFLLLVFASAVFGLAMGPARVEYIFKPNLANCFELIVTENAGEETEIIMYAEGALAEYVTELSPPNFTLQPYESKTVEYCFQLPESLPQYGKNETLIVAKTGTRERRRTGQVLAVVAIAHQWWVHVPYPHKYAVLGIQTENVPLSVVQSRQPVFFDVSQTNLGNSDLNTELVFEVLDPSGKLVKRFEPRENFLPKEETIIEEFDWIAEDSNNIRPGVYTAQASLKYGGSEPAISTQTFKVGAAIVFPKRIEVESFELGEIAKIHVKMESLWGNAIDNVFTRGFLLNEAGTTIRQTPPSQAVTVDAWNNRGVDIFLDTGGLQAKTYDLNVVVFFGNDNASQIFPFVISPLTEAPPKAVKEDNSVLLLLGAGILVLLIVIIVLLFFLFKKRMLGKEKPAKTRAQK